MQDILHQRKSLNLNGIVRLLQLFLAARGVDLRNARRCGASGAAQGALLYILEGRGKENLFDGILDVLPKLLQAAVRPFGANGANAVLRMGAARFGEGAVDKAQHFADGDLRGRASEGVAAVDASAAFEHAAALQFEKNLLEILKRDMMPRGDIVNGHDFGVLH